MKIIEQAGGSTTISEMIAVVEKTPSLKSALEERWPDWKRKFMTTKSTKVLERTITKRDGEYVWRIG